jgi:hypothetical protein
MQSNLASATLPVAALSPAMRSAKRVVLAGLRAHGLHLSLTGIYFLAMVATIWSRPDAIEVAFDKIVGVILGMSVALTVAFITLQRYWHMVAIAKPERPIIHFSTDLTRELFDARRWATGLPMALAMLPFMYVYAIFKYNIPVIAPFSWDTTFEAWGRTLHLGFLPWQWLEPYLSNVPVTVLLSVNYFIWAAVLWGMAVALGFSGRNDELRTRFFLTFMLTWSIGGTVIAILFSSAGPCFWQQLHLPGNPYAGIMENLQKANAVVPLGVIEEQNTLWMGYSKHTLIAGISAMPSMHNATALLLALTALHLGRSLSILLWCHCILVFLGSIWLGWHYSIDAYAAFAITSFFWWASKPIAARWHALSFVKEFDALLAEIPHRDGASASASNSLETANLSRLLANLRERIRDRLAMNGVGRASAAKQSIRDAHVEKFQHAKGEEDHRHRLDDGPHANRRSRLPNLQIILFATRACIAEYRPGLLHRTSRVLGGTKRSAYGDALSCKFSAPRCRPYGRCNMQHNRNCTPVSQPRSPQVRRLLKEQGRTPPESRPSTFSSP